MTAPSLAGRMARTIGALLQVRIATVLALAMTFASGAGLVACAAAEGTALPAKRAPRLLVFLVVDGLPQRQVVDYRDQLAPDGLARFLDRGAWYANAHYGHAYTVTAAGHATMLTGADPARTGIIGNEWRDRETGEPTYCTGDTDYSYLGAGNTTSKLDGTSPKNLRAETVGDMLRKADARSKVIAVSGKDRGAILTAGKTGTAYMYMRLTGQFASSTFYMKAHPAWVDAFNAEKRGDRYFRQPWKPLLPDDAYARSQAFEMPWYADGGRLPAMMGATQTAPDGAFYNDLLRSPFVDAMTLDFARAAIAGEQMGRDDVPDVLSISLSGHDYVNHAFGAESRLSQDHLLQLDRLLEAFFKDLDATIGKNNYAAVLTADHGFMPAPEQSKAEGRDAGRQSGAQALAHVNAGLSKRFGEGRWAPYFSASALVLDRQLIASRKVDFDAVADEARTLLLAEPGVGAAYTRRELQSGSRAGAPLFDAMRRSWNSERSGDVQFALKPYWMMGAGSTMTTHGSAHEYDTHVPILLWGPTWVRPGRVDAPVEVVDIAPTLSRWLGVPNPPMSQGRVLPQPATTTTTNAR